MIRDILNASLHTAGVLWIVVILHMLTVRHVLTPGLLRSDMSTPYDNRLFCTDCQDTHQTFVLACGQAYNT